MFAGGWLRRRNGGLGRVCKWMGLATCVLMSVVWILSLFILVWMETGYESITIAKGGITIIGLGGFPRTERQVTGSIGQQISGPIWVPALRRGPQTGVAGFSYVAFIPFWLVLAVAALPTSVLFYRDRRYPPGHCQRCGYNLTGNMSGVCPECGGAVHPD